MTQLTETAPAPDTAAAIVTQPADMAATDPRRRAPRGRYKIRGPETWALIRESYLAGASARELAERYDVTEWAIWRRAWKKGWTKQDRVEPPPPPALEPVTPADPPAVEHADPAALARMALRGVATALRQNRLAEARNLSQIAASLDRIGGGAAAGGGYTLQDMVRVIFDADFQTETMRMDRDQENPPEKRQYWTLWREQGQADGKNLAALRSRGYAEGRADQRAELGLEPEDAGPDHWVWYADTFVKRHVLEAKRERMAEQTAGWRARMDETGDDPEEPTDVSG